MDVRELESPNNKSPKMVPNRLSTIFFCWTLPLFARGLKKQLEEEDLLSTSHRHESKLLGDQLESAWNYELAHRKNPSLWRANIKFAWRHFASLSVLFMIGEIAKILQTLSLGQLMRYYMFTDSNMTKADAYLYASAIAGISLLVTFTGHNYLIGLQYLGMKMRIAHCSLIYRKSLKLSRKALGTTTIGQLVNLLSNDVNRFERAVIHLHTIWFSPILISLVLYLIYSYVGITACSGVATFAVYLPLQAYLAKRMSVLRLRTAIKTDERVRLMNEIIAGIKVIKMYTWEKPFAALVAQIRKLEIRQIRFSSYFRGGIMSFANFSTRFGVFVSILVYVFLGHTPDAYYVFVVSQFYSSLRVMMTLHLPQGMAEIGELNISIRRIQNMLLYDEIKAENTKATNKKNAENGDISLKTANETGVQLVNATAKWAVESSDNTLTDINLKIGKQELVAVIGSVGSGKSSLLQVILKELPLIEGTAEVRGRVSYAAQEPWLFTGSIRQNILFGEPMDLKKYREVVRVCALERDFTILPHGDLSTVGDRGVMLSGGQKARINLARAAYRDADIYLLDDPLSAVDTHVGKQIFEECVMKYLKTKSVILVTHQLQYLGQVNNLIVMDSGSIVAQGTYEELHDKGYFGQLLRDQTEIKDEEPEKEVEKIDMEKKKAPVEEKEHRSYGGLSGRIYSAYMNAGGGGCLAFTIMLCFVVTQLIASLCDYFVTFWVNLEQSRAEDVNNNVNVTASWKNFFTSETCTYIYSGLTVVMIVLTLFRSFIFFNFCMRASTNLHNNMFSKIVYAPMYFFNTNPSGRILNRFSKDMGSVDEILPMTVTDALTIGLNCMGIVVTISYVNYWLTLPFVVIAIMMYYSRKVYMATSRNVKRLEGITRSPVFTHINASLQGLATIRAFKVQPLLKREFDNYQDTHTSAYATFIACTRTFGFWIDFVLGIYILIVTYSFLIIGKETYAGNVGLAITQALGLTGMVQWGMRQVSEFENQMTSVERIVEYMEITPEKIKGGIKPSKEWPEHGSIEFRSIYMRYSLNDPYVLKNLCFYIKPTEKVGIVGRTGAGKSSLITALFLLSDIDGSILIDGIDTKETNLELLRSKLSIIPQEPVLFSGSLRKNLDPFEEFSDDDLWKALEEVELKGVVADFPSGLEHSMSEGGSNFSVGQRQLLCLARALIRKNKILVMDEATANVDNKTDELIQTTIRKKFVNCTVLTIAHRLHTVMDSDKVLVMDEGCVVEFDHPHLLLQNKDGILYSLIQQTGSGMAENLQQIAEKSFQEKHQQY